MRKTKLKHLLQIECNQDLSLGKRTKIMVWSPIDHCWYCEEDFSRINEKYFKKFLLKQEVMRFGLRNDSLDTIAIFLKDYGKEKNCKLRLKWKR